MSTVNTSSPYSSVASTLLNGSIQYAKQPDLSNETRDTLLGNSLQAVIDSAETTNQEKVLAKMGLDASVHDGTMSWDSVVAVRRIAAQTIASMVTGGLGCAVTTFAQDAWNAVKDETTYRMGAQNHITESALKTLIDNTDKQSVEHSIAASIMTTTKGIADLNDRARLRYQTLEQIGQIYGAQATGENAPPQPVAEPPHKSSGWHWFRKHQDPPPTQTTPKPPEVALETLMKRLPEALNARAGQITDQARRLIEAPRLVSNGSKEIYHIEQIRGEFMKTAIQGYLDAMAVSFDDASKQTVEHDFDRQLTVMKQALDGVETRYREEALQRVADHTRLLEESLGSTP